MLLDEERKKAIVSILLREREEERKKEIRDNGEMEGGGVGLTGTVPEDER